MGRTGRRELTLAEDVAAVPGAGQAQAIEDHDLAGSRGCERVKLEITADAV